MKSVLLIAGGGTLGRYTAQNLRKLGCSVDIICLEDNTSSDKGLRFYKASADLEFLKAFLKDKHYDGIVNFMHYSDPEAYKPVHMLLSENTGHLIFLSSYRVYADLEHPVKETSPTLYDTSDDEELLKNDNYAIPKSKAEYFIKNESGTKNWTIVRPVISFSDRRLDVVTVSGRRIIESAKNKLPVLLPEKAKNLTAGLDWAGNSGKLIANLLFKSEAMGEVFTVSSAQNLTWGEVADIYSELTGVKFEWTDIGKYISENPEYKMSPWGLKYDRLFDRKIDNAKILKVTGLKKEDFTPIRDGIKHELEKIESEENFL